MRKKSDVVFSFCYKLMMHNVTSKRLKDTSLSDVLHSVLQHIQSVTLSMHSGKRHMHTVLSHFTGPSSMHIELCWMPMASGLTPASQASDAQAGDPSQLSSNLPVTSANEETRRNGYRARRCILTVAAAIHGEGERLISDEQLPFPLCERKRQPDTELETMCAKKHRSLYSVLTYAPSARLLIFGDSEHFLWQRGARAVTEKRPKQATIKSNWYEKGLHVNLLPLYSPVSKISEDAKMKT